MALETLVCDFIWDSTQDQWLFLHIKHFDLLDSYNDEERVIQKQKFANKRKMSDIHFAFLTEARSGTISEASSSEEDLTTDQSLDEVDFENSNGFERHLYKEADII